MSKENEEISTNNDVDEVKDNIELETDEEEPRGAKLDDLFGDNQLSMTFGFALTGLSVFIVLIVGLISGITFFTIVWRMILAAAFFFVFGFGLGVLVKYFIPEIGQFFEGGEAGESLGEKIDMLAGDGEEPEDQSTYMDGFHQDEKAGGRLDEAGKSIEQEFNIPNDPKLLAKGVSTMLHKDDS